MNTIMQISNSNKKKAILLVSLSITLLLLVLFIKDKSSHYFYITAILNKFGIWNTPSWLINVLMGVGAVSAVVALFATAGMSIPATAAAMLAGADTASA